MALITCPTCKREISRSSKQCPYCGRPMAGEWTFTRASSSKVAGIGVVLIVAGIGVSFATEPLGIMLICFGVGTFLIGWLL